MHADAQLQLASSPPSRQSRPASTRRRYDVHGMKQAVWFIIVVFVALFLVLRFLGTGGGYPDVFSESAYETASAQAASEGKLLIAHMTATWCGPCREMNRTTYVDSDVVAWLNEHAVIVPVDVDRSRDLATSLGVQAMPTMILFRDGEEISRVQGFLTAAQFLNWVRPYSSPTESKPASSAT